MATGSRKGIWRSNLPLPPTKAIRLWQALCMHSTCDCLSGLIVIRRAAFLTIASLLMAGMAADQSAFAQQLYAVTGSVTDSSDTPLARATVVALARADSALVAFGTTRDDGTFRVERLRSDALVLQVSYVGMETTHLDFDVDGADVDVGTIVLLPQTEELEEFVVTADRLPYVVRGDTIEYNPLAFLLRPQDMVEDLLRRLPGINVDRYGAIYARGKLVEHVLVEGKRFFSSDYTIATRNLPADAVEKVQLYDQPSDMAKLTGVPDGRDEQTINLDLTEEATRGAFGQTTGGFGGSLENQERYFGRATLFRFAPKTQLALIGNANNVNQPGFGGSQLSSFRGAGPFMAAGNGITEALGGGFNFNRDFGESTTVNASYFLTDVTNKQETTEQRQQLLGTAVSAYEHDTIRRRNGGLTHSVVVQGDVELGEGHDLSFEGTLNQRFSSSGQTGQENKTDATGRLLTDASRMNSSNADQLSGRAEINWRKRISESGRAVVLSNSVSATDAATDTRLDTEIRLRSVGELLTREEVRQLQESENSSFTYRNNLRLLQPIAGRMLNIYLERTATDRRRDKAFYDQTGDHSTQYPFRTEDYGQHYEYWRTGTDLTWSSEDGAWWIWGKLGIKHSRRRGTVQGSDEPVRSRYTNVVPWLLLQKDYDGGQVQIGYEFDTREPTLQQLQPITDNSNPLSIYTGNPALTPEYQHEFSGRLSFDRGYSGSRFALSLNTYYTANSIIFERTVDAQLRQSLRPVNAGKRQSLGGYVSFSRPIRTLGLELNVMHRVNQRSSTELVNGAENVNTQLRHRPSLEISYYYGEKVGFTVDGELSWNRTRYSLNDELNQSYTNGTVDAEVFWNASELWSSEVSMLYRTFDRDLFGASRDIALLNLSLARVFFEGRGILELELHDALNRSQDFALNSAATYIQEVRTVSLGRYVMLKFTYKPRLLRR